MDPLPLPDDPLRFVVLVAMGTAMVVSGMLGACRISALMGLDPGIGAVLGIAVGAAGLVLFLT